MTRVLAVDDPLALAATAAIRTGDLVRLRSLLAEQPWLAAARIGPRSLLHVVADWPGHVPHGARTVSTLVEAGADVNARFLGGHVETPLHWAASCDDVAVLDALLDAGADIEAPGAVLGGGSPLADARGFKQWRAAWRLVERGASTTLADAAGLGLGDRVAALLAARPDAEQVSLALWAACHGGRTACAELLLAHGADLDVVPPWEELTPLDAAERDGADELAGWLRERGAHRFAELTGPGGWVTSR